jgi:acyl-CoA synthetase (NDP forming)
VQGYAGRVHLVNPRTPVVHGQATVPTLADIDGPVDLVFFVLGGERVVDVAAQAGELGMKNLVVLSGGFRESGVEGAGWEQRLLEIADKYGQVVLGPNTIGFVNVTGSVSVYGTRCENPVPRGPVGIATQSGMMLSGGINALGRQGVGMTLMVGVGNEAMISIDKVVDYFVDDEQTEVIGLFLESVRDPATFRRAATRALDLGKPIVALASARTAVTADFAASHTGTLVGDQRVVRAAFDDLGIIAVTSLEDYYATVSYFAHHKPIRGRRIAFTAITGGKCEVFADRAIELGLEMPTFSPGTHDALKAILPPFAAVKNPLDCTGAVKTDTVTAAIDILARDENVDAVVYDVWSLRIGTPDADQLAANGRALGEVAASVPAPIMPVGLTYDEDTILGPDYFREHGLAPEISGMEHGLFALERGAWWSECRARARVPQSDVAAVDPERSAALRPSLTETRVLDILADAGISVVPHRECSSAAEVVAAANTIGYPVAVKISSPDIAHKSRIGAVVLDVADDTAATAAFATVDRAARAAHPGARIDGVMVAPMRRGGIELIAGVKRDPSWGPVLMLGFGGVWVEQLDDSVITLLPTSLMIIERKLRELRGAYQFDGGHGLRATDLALVASQVMAIGDFAFSLGSDLTSLEINPLWVGDDGERTQIEALDALVTFRQ